MALNDTELLCSQVVLLHTFSFIRSLCSLATLEIYARCEDLILQKRIEKMRNNNEQRKETKDRSSRE